jgi:hypothetical protein
MHEATDVMGAASRGIALAAPTAMAAAAAASGSETFKGTIVTSRVSGTRTVITFAAPGRFTGPAVLARNPDGSCSSAQDPLHAVDMITATGTLSF